MKLCIKSSINFPVPLNDSLDRGLALFDSQTPVCFNLIAGNVKRKACDLYYTSQSIRDKGRKIRDQNFVKGFLHILISLLLSGIQTNRCPSKGNKIAILS